MNVMYSCLISSLLLISILYRESLLKIFKILPVGLLHIIYLCEGMLREIHLVTAHLLSLINLLTTYLLPLTSDGVDVINIFS